MSSDESDINKPKVSIVHIQPGYIAYFKGLYNFIFTCKNKSEKAYNIVNFIGNVFVPCGAIFTYFLLTYIVYCIIIIYNLRLSDDVQIYDNMEPEYFNSNYGDKCITDANGHIIKCTIHMKNGLTLYLFSFLYTFIILIFMGIFWMIIHDMFYYMYPLIYEFINSVPQIFSEYSQYRHKVKEDVRKNTI